MATQLTLFTSLQPQAKLAHSHDEVVFLAPGKIVEVTELSRRIRSLYVDLRRNREYVMFTRSSLKAAWVLGESIEEITVQSTRKNFRAKYELAKRELTEISSWLSLLKKGHLLKGDYQSYADEVSDLLNEISLLIRFLRKRKLVQAA